MRQVEIVKKPKKFLEKLFKKDSIVATKILSAIDSLSLNHLPNSSKQLAGHEGYIELESINITLFIDLMTIELRFY